MKFKTSRKFKFEIRLVEEIESQTLKEAMAEMKKKYKGAEIKPVRDFRTLKQNSALHLWFTQLSEELNEKGFDMRKLIRQEVELSWTPYNVKEYLWRPFQKALFGHKSTTKLAKTEEIDKIYDNLNRVIIERTKGEADVPPFPNIDDVLYKEINE